MSVDSRIRRLMETALAVVDDHDTHGRRLIDDSRRLFTRVNKFLTMKLIATEPDMEAMELACFAIYLPMRETRLLASGKLGKVNLRDRSEQAAEVLVNVAGEQIPDSLLDRTTRLLHEACQRNPMLEDAKLLADALNLDDFGITGLMMQAIQLARQGGGVTQIIEGADKREQYGYWEARLKDSFHFEPVRRIAVQRLQAARSVIAMLAQEIAQDSA